MTSVDLDTLKTWVGRTESRSDLMTASPLAALAATLDREDTAPQPGTPVPPLWHWIYHTPQALAREIGPDGHPRRGGFLPPVALPRRMWAGGRLAFPGALRVGDRVRRESRVVSVDHKRGRTGDLVFVLVRHEFHGPTGLALTEEHDIVYRDLPVPGAPGPAPVPAPQDAEWARTVVPDDVLLFRYSALTFNGHRIHYDRRHATMAEGYPGLIVHGPLIATLLVDLLRRERPGARIAAFEFRAVKPLFDIAPFAVCGRPDPDGRTVRLWARDAEGSLAMEAKATVA